MTPGNRQLPIASEVAVVIPHLDRLWDTEECYRSLMAQTSAPAAIILVDNASKTHAAAELAAACPRAEILRLDENRGFAGGVNAGIRRALQRPNVGFVWVLNNDTACAPDALEKLRAAAGLDSRIGLVGCPLWEGDEGGPRRIVPSGKRLMEPWAIPTEPPTGKTPDYLSGACLLIRRELLEDVGLFDEGFFFFFEDADLSRRAADNGWRLAVASEARVEHRGSATIRELGEMQARCYRAGHIRFLRKHSGHPFWAAVFPFALRLAADALRMNRKALRGNWRGWQAGWQAPISTPELAAKSGN